MAVIKKNVSGFQLRKCVVSFISGQYECLDATTCLHKTIEKHRGICIRYSRLRKMKIHINIKFQTRHTLTLDILTNSHVIQGYLVRTSLEFIIRETASHEASQQQCDPACCFLTLQTNRPACTWAIVTENVRDGEARRVLRKPGTELNVLVMFCCSTDQLFPTLHLFNVREEEPTALTASTWNLLPIGDDGHQFTT
jgi:hypothetical protein